MTAIHNSHEFAIAEDATPTGRLYDGMVVFLVGVLMTVGVVMVYSASVTLAGSEFSWTQWWNTPLRQSIFAIGGFVVMLVAAHIDYRSLAWYRPGDGWRSISLLLLAAVLLVAALVVPDPNFSHVGGQRSLNVRAGGLTIGFQPAEFAKVALVVALSAFLTRPRDEAALHAPPARSHGDHVWPARRVATARLPFLSGFAPAVAGAGLLIGLTGIADFGTAALMGAIMLALLVMGGARWSHLALLGLLGMLAGAALILMAPYRVQRLMSFMAEEADESGAAYQVTQSLIAIGSGSWWGRGLGAGVQKYGYLPQDNNDFILAVICEELGVAGGIAIACVFLLLLWRGWRLSRTAEDPFGRLLAAGLTLMICLQAAFNIGVVTHAIPTKGISLPFVSAGGSGVLFLGLAAGLLASVGRRMPNAAAQQHGEAQPI